MDNEQDEVIVDEVEENNEEVEENAEEKPSKSDKPKRTPQEELKYFEGRIKRLKKDLGLDSEVEPKKEAQSAKPGELDKGDKALLVAYGIKGADEFTLAKNFMNRTGEDIDTLVEDEIFQAKLLALRKAKETADAMPKSNRRTASASGDEFAIAKAKYEETGELPANRELREKIVEDRLNRETKNKMFYNS